MRKITKILLTAGMLGALLCGGALAATAGGTTGDFTVKSTTGTTTYDETSRTLTIEAAGTYTISTPSQTADVIMIDKDVSGAVNLTLDGVNITTDEDFALYNHSGQALTITLVGENSLVSGDETQSSGTNTNFDGAAIAFSAGIFSTGDLTIKGTGSLTAQGGVGGTSAGIDIGDNVLTIEKGSTVSATGGEAPASAGIYSMGTQTITNNGTLTATGGLAEAGIYAGTNVEATSAGIYSGGALTITGSGKIDATGGTAKSAVVDGTALAGTSAGIYSEKELTITDTTITATGGTATDADGATITTTSVGIHGRSDAQDVNGVFITNSTVTATAGAATGTSAGIYGSNTTSSNSVSGVFITGSTVTATGGAAPTSAGIYGSNTAEIGSAVTIKSSTKINATAAAATDISAGIYGVGAINIGNYGSFTATGGKAGNRSAGIYSTSAMVIGNSGSLTAKAGEAGNYSTGIYSGGTLVIANTGSVTAIGGTATGAEGISAGIYSVGALTIQGGCTIKEAAGGDATGANATSVGIYSGGTLNITDESLVTATGETQGIQLKDSGTLTADETLPVFAGETAADATEITNNGTDLSEQVCTEENKYVRIGRLIEEEDDRPYTPPTPHETTTRPTTGGTTTVDKPEANRNALVTVTPTPDDGYTVGQVVVTDKDGNEVALTENADGTFSFRMPEGGVEVEVSYIEDETPAKVSPFTDLSEEDDAFEAVLALYEAGIINGMSQTSFGGNEHINRAMITTMLHRMVGNPYADRSHFSDVADGQWYTMGIDWAVSVGLVDGYPDGSFNGTKTITNQEICKILRDYAIYMGVEVDETLTAEGVDDWASNAVAWAQSLGIFAGDPTAPVTRAQACKMICAVLEIIE